MPQTFKKTKEDFTCENCGTHVTGTGYTNHCPECFFSKHVDINPGDRAEGCGGLMKPISVQGSTNKLTITQKCLRCSFIRNNKIQNEDNLERLAEVIQTLNSQK